MRRVGPETDFGCFGRTWSARQTSQADMPTSVTCERSQSPATTSRLHPSCTSVARRVRRPDRQAGSPAFGPRLVRAATCGTTDPRPRFHSPRGLSFGTGRVPARRHEQVPCAWSVANSIVRRAPEPASPSWQSRRRAPTFTGAAGAAERAVCRWTAGKIVSDWDRDRDIAECAQIALLVPQNARRSGLHLPRFRFRSHIPTASHECDRRLLTTGAIGSTTSGDG
jgi:hypothetical protein